MSAIKPYEHPSAHWDTARERDSREKLEKDVSKFCLRLSDSGTVVGTEPLNRIRNAAVLWLNRQAAITERECMTASGLAATEAPKLIPKVDGLAEERDRLRRQVELKDGIIEGLRQSLDETIAERNELAAKLEAKEQLERDSSYMRLPVDANGVPIRPGDMLEYDGSKPLKVDSIRLDKRGRWHLHFDGRLGDWWAGASSHHVQPDTVESLLEEFHGKLWSDDEEQMALLDEYAERIRKAVEQ